MKISEYTLTISIKENDADLYLVFSDKEGRETRYSPVINAVFQTEIGVVYYTESKSGDEKHAYSLTEKEMVSISLIEDLEPIAEIVDYARY